MPLDYKFECLKVQPFDLNLKLPNPMCSKLPSLA